MTLGKIETGWTRNPRPETLAVIEDALQRLEAQVGVGPPAQPRVGLKRWRSRRGTPDAPAVSDQAQPDQAQFEIAEYFGVSLSEAKQLLGADNRANADEAATGGGTDRDSQATVLEFDLNAEISATGLSKAEFAEKAGVSVTSLWRLGSGKGKAKPGTEQKVRQTLQELAAERGEPRDFGVVAEPHVSPDLDVRSKRRGLGTSQEELSEKAGVSVKRIAAMEESGVDSADPHDVAAVNDALARIEEARREEPLSHIREEREALGLSVAGLAEMAGVSKKTVARLEEEATLRPNRETRRAIRAALDQAAAERELQQPMDLRTERESLGVQLNEVAERADVHPNTLSLAERGLRELRPDKRAAVEAVLTDIAAERAEESSRDLKAEMSALGIEKSEVAVRAGVAEKTVARFLNGGRPLGSTQAAMETAISEMAAERAESGTRRLAVGNRPVPVGELSVRIPNAPRDLDLPAAPAMPPHLNRLGPQAAYLDATMRGFAEGRRHGVEAAQQAEVAWTEGGTDAGAVVQVDAAAAQLAEARQVASRNDIGAQQATGVDWERDAPYRPPPGTAEAARQAEALRDAVFPHSRAGAAPAQMTTAEVHGQRFTQAAWNGYQHGWAATMAQRALQAADDQPDLSAPDVTPEMRAAATLPPSAPGPPSTPTTQQRPDNASNVPRAAATGLDAPSATRQAAPTPPAQNTARSAPTPAQSMGPKPGIELKLHKGMGA